MTHPRRILTAYGLEPKKSLGQNFLFDPSVLEKIVGSAEIHPTDHVLEVGAGLGSLTYYLAHRAQQVTTVELDNRLIPILQQQLAGCDNVRILHGDILDLDLSATVPQPYKVVANVPYYITGAIVRHLLTSKHRPTDIVLTVQREVAERISAETGKLSLLAVSVQLYGTPSIVSSIEAGTFWPRPKIDSAILKISDIHDPHINEKQFFRVLKAGFSQKRKQLKNNLRSLGFSAEQIAHTLSQINLDGRRRAQTLSVAEWKTLTTAIYN